MYLAAEGGIGFVNRVAAILKHYKSEGKNVPLVVLPRPINLLDPKADRDVVITMVDDAAKEFAQPVVWIIVDTLSRVMAGGNRNGPEAMTGVVGVCDYIRHNCADRPHLSLIHHTGKNASRGARGHNSLLGALDTEIETARTAEGADKAFSATVTNQRDMSSGDVFQCTLETVTFGHDEDGDPVTSAVVIHKDVGDTSAARKTKGPLKGKNLEIFRSLMNVLAAPTATPGQTTKDAWWKEAVRDGSCIDIKPTDTHAERKSKRAPLPRQLSPFSSCLAGLASPAKTSS